MMITKKKLVPTVIRVCFVCLALSFFSNLALADPSVNIRISAGSALHPVSALTYGNGTFVAVGWQGLVLSSTDGINWTEGSVDWTEATSAKDLYAITYGNGVFVAVGWEGLVLSSTDGISWTEGSAGTTDTLNGVAYGNGTFVAVGYHLGHTFTSSDGKDWTVTHEDLSAQCTYNGPSNPTCMLNTVTYGNGKFVALGEYGYHAESADGITWTGGYGYGMNYSGDAPSGIESIAYAKGIFVAVGKSQVSARGVIYSSSDGLNWKLRYLQPSPTSLADLGNGDGCSSVTYGNGTFVAVGKYVFMSGDGITWSKDTFGYYANPDGEFLTSLTYGRGTFVAGDNYGEIFQTDPVTDACTATLSDDLTLHIPVVAYGGKYYWADLSYVPNSTNTMEFSLKDEGEISDFDLSDFATCTPSTLSGDMQLHIPRVISGNGSYWGTLQYNDGWLFTVTDVGEN
jgi:hypothetical protein